MAGFPEICKPPASIPKPSPRWCSPTPILIMCGALSPRTAALRFPNATYFVGAAEWDYWMDPEYRVNMPAELHAFAEGAQRDLRAVRDRIVMLRPGDDIVPGLRAIDTAGHTFSGTVGW
jgi:glyoxylase-like metal-dependent hydrolase (beta-lactamase superfamily II)